MQELDERQAAFESGRNAARPFVPIVAIRHVVDSAVHLDAFQRVNPDGEGKIKRIVFEVRVGQQLEPHVGCFGGD